MKTQWEQYKELELLPAQVAAPQTIYSPLVAALDRHWRSRLDQRARKLDHEYQVEYLEQRLTLTCVRATTTANIWRKCWSFLNQPVRFQPYLSAHSEPEIRRTLDQAGQSWWQVYDPLTGRTAYLESEAEVQVWLEERLYH
ncbi:MAG: hypothetical protein RBJ76_23940 [Stenomitos frigidus ULC029]